jgi:DNA primase
MDNSLKDRVLDAVDIVAVIGERVRLTRKGKDYLGLCPFHPDHKPSLSVSPSKRLYKCWSCGAGGDVIRFVEKTERVEFREALAKLAERAGIELRPSTPSDQRSEQLRTELWATTTWARQHFQRNLSATPGGKAARDYAQRRGLSDETIERFSLGFAADAWDDLLGAARKTGLRLELLEQAGLVATNESGRSYDRFRNRLIFPINDASGRTVAFGGRALGDDPAKYLNSPETGLFSKSRVLYGFDLARRAIEKQKAAIIVEGYMDAVLLVQHGFEHVVATLGTALTDAHVKLLRPLTERIFLCFDSDAAGVRAADRAVELALRSQFAVRVVALEDKDPADCVVAAGAAGFEARLHDAVDALQFKWLQTVRLLGDRGGQSRRAALEEYVEFVAGVSSVGGMNPLDQNLVVGRLSELLGVPPDEVFALFARARRAIRRPQSKAGSADAASEYEASVRALPAGLMTAAESVLGLLLRDSRFWPSVNDAVAAGMEHSETWRRLYAVLVEAHHDVGEYSLEEVMARCEDSALCELIERALARISDLEVGAEAFTAARDRLTSELDVLQMGDLRTSVHAEQARGQDADATFRSLREMARKHHAALSADRRRSAVKL